VLRNTAPSERFVLVVGPSGSGKSSLVRAGVVPRLRRLDDPWLVIPPFRPGARPLKALAEALCAALAAHGRQLDVAECRSRLAAGPKALAELLDELRAAAGELTDRPVLLAIDQGEQLVSQSARTERIEALELVFATLADTPQLRVIVALRSEYVQEFVEGSAFEGNPLPIVPVGRLTPGRLVEIIELPAHRVGIEFEPGLVQAMVEETAAGPSGAGDPLPLLAFALRELYDRRPPDGRVITWASYESSGGVVAALTRHADAVSERLRDKGMGDLIVPTLLRLVHVEADRQPSSRSIPRPEFHDDEWKVVQAFVDERLLTTDGPEPVVHVAHDALLRAWKRLADAIDDFRDELVTRSRLRRDAREWQLADQEHSFLLGGIRLQAAMSAVASPRWTADPLVEEYVAASRLRARQQRRRTRLLIGAIVLASLVLLALLGRAGYDRVEERMHRNAARGATVKIGGLTVDVHEVTDAQFALCSGEGRCQPAADDRGNRLDHIVEPGARAVVMVDAAQAAAFCRWIGRRLPTIDEAERAARSNQLHELLRGGSEWTSTPHGEAFKVVTHEAATGKVGRTDVNRKFRDSDITFRCAV
jgi:hypothetical protein